MHIVQKNCLSYFPVLYFTYLFSWVKNHFTWIYQILKVHRLVKSARNRMKTKQLKQFNSQNERKISRQKITFLSLGEPMKFTSPDNYILVEQTSLILL